MTQKNAAEIETLNLDDLDVEELEQRMELALASAGTSGFVQVCETDIDICQTNTNCGANCSNNTCGCNSDSCFVDYSVIGDGENTV